jgi:Na+-transporting methylmalonyl-CoA/oxaloacetate decarboxylase gamma subunit
MENLGQALEIAAFGMGIVFAALLGLIGVLYALNRLLPGKQPEEEVVAAESADMFPPEAAAAAAAGVLPSADDKARAAVAAVAVALAMAAGGGARAAVPQGAPASGMTGWRASNLSLSGQGGDPQNWQGRVWRNDPWQRGG